MKHLCKISIITHASAMAFSRAITYIVVNQQKNIIQQCETYNIQKGKKWKVHKTTQTDPRPTKK